MIRFTLCNLFCCQGPGWMEGGSPYSEFHTVNGAQTPRKLTCIDGLTFCQRRKSGFPRSAKCRARDSFIVKIEQISTWFYSRTPKTKGKSCARDIFAPSGNPPKNLYYFTLSDARRFYSSKGELSSGNS